MYGLSALLERQADVQPDRLASRFARAAVGRFHDAGAAAGGDDEAVVRGGERQAPLRQHPRELARILVKARPLESLARLVQFFLVRGVGVALAARAERPQRTFRAFTAVDARRAEKHHGVLYPLLFEASQRFEILGHNPDRTRFLAVEKIGIQVRHRRLPHRVNVSSTHKEPSPHARDSSIAAR